MGIVSGISALRGGGAPLSSSERSFFEPRFRADFGRVRVHSGSRANEAARSINARAFTHGSDIAFAKSEYSPGTEKGRSLLAHELTHVIQQKGVNVQTKNNGNGTFPGMIQEKLVSSEPLVQAYGKKVHFTMTLKEAQSGNLFNATDAHTIASANHAVDKGPNHPHIKTPKEFINPNIRGSNMLHFPSRFVATVGLLTAIKKCNLSKFGAALHRYQDSYSHNFTTWSVPLSRILSSYCWAFTSINPILKALVGAVLFSNPSHGRMAVLKHACLGNYPDGYKDFPEQKTRDNAMRNNTKWYLKLYKRKCP